MQARPATLSRGRVRIAASKYQPAVRGLGFDGGAVVSIRTVGASVLLDPIEPYLFDTEFVGPNPEEIVGSDLHQLPVVDSP